MLWNKQYEIGIERYLSGTNDLAAWQFEAHKVTS